MILKPESQEEKQKQAMALLRMALLRLTFPNQLVTLEKIEYVRTRSSNTPAAITGPSTAPATTAPTSTGTAAPAATGHGVHFAFKVGKPRQEFQVRQLEELALETALRVLRGF